MAATLPGTELPHGVRLVRTLVDPLSVWTFDFDPEGVLLATGTFDMMRLWSVETGELVRTIEGHSDMVRSVAFAASPEIFATASDDRTVKVWQTRSGALLHTLKDHSDWVRSVAIDSHGRTLASGSDDRTIKIWDIERGTVRHTLRGHISFVMSVVFDPSGAILASGGYDATVRIWDAHRGQLRRTMQGHDSFVACVVFDRKGKTLASGGGDGTVKIWDPQSGKLLRTVEGHTAAIHSIAYSPDGRLFASFSDDQTIRLWSCETWATVAVIPEKKRVDRQTSLAFHPKLPILASVGTEPELPEDSPFRAVHLWELDYEALSRRQAGLSAAARPVHHTTAKIMLLGDHSVGKSALGYRLIHNRFEKQESTHGQQFWVLPALGERRADGTECEAILWDFAGQPDYRLVHALFVDNADLALVLFDASDLRDPLHGVDFWLKQLQTAQSRCRIILVAAQTDRGTGPLTREELEVFCKRHGIAGPIATSAATGEGIKELVDRMKSLILWDEKPATVTTATFKRIKDYVLGLKEAREFQVIVTPEELRNRLQATDREREFTDAEMLTAVGHLENYGYVRRLKTSRGELRILLQPERLNNLASSFVLEARRNPKGLGALEEKRLLAGAYEFPELKDLNADERDVLLDSAALLFLEHNVCFRVCSVIRTPLPARRSGTTTRAMK